MTRRAAILATIAAIPAATQSIPQIASGSASDGGTTVFSIELQSGPRSSLEPKDCKPVGADGFLVSCTYDVIQEPKYVLAVKYGNRVAHITAAELMDALEGK
jgi:hypothetical protein